MKKPLIQQLLILVGISLPILMVLFFLVATKLPQFIIDPPQYSFLFTVDDFNSNSADEVRIFSTQERIKTEYRKVKAPQSYRQRTRLYLFDAKTQDTKEIPLTVPAGAEDHGEEWTAFEIPDLTPLQINTTPISPDGYELDTNYGDSSGLVPVMFWGSSHRNQITLNKDGFRVKVLKTDRYLTYYNTKFLGWIVSSGSNQ